MKAAGYQRIQLRIGNNGFAAVLITPTFCKDLPNIFHTEAGTNLNPQSHLNPFQGGGYGGPSDNFSTGPGWTYNAPANLPFAHSQFDNSATADGATDSNLTGRVVSVGIRATYTGTELKRGGQIMYHCSPSHGNISGQTSDFAALSRETVVYQCDRRYKTGIISAINMPETELSSKAGMADAISISNTDGLYPYTPTYYWLESQSPNAVNYGGAPYFQSRRIGAPIALMTFTGEPGNTFYVEVVTHVEYAGNAASSMARSNPSDVQGAQRVAEASQSISRMLADDPSRDPWSAMYGVLSDMAKDAVPALVGAGKEALLRAIMA